VEVRAGGSRSRRQVCDILWRSFVGEGDALEQGTQVNEKKKGSKGTLTEVCPRRDSRKKLM